MKSRDFEPELKPFFKIFSELIYRNDAHNVFADFLSICTNWFGNGNFIEERDRSMSRYSDDEKQLFNALFTEMVTLYSKKIKVDSDWYDPFGNFYQEITSHWKASKMGQFFTPESVVTMLAQMIVPQSKMHFTCAEPSAGSGRFVLATHAANPMGFYWAVDLDPICVQMTAVNMALHNACGVVLHANALWEEREFYRAYHVARVKVGEDSFLPCIQPVSTYQEAREIFDHYRTYTHYHNLAYHFTEYMAYLNADMPTAVEETVLTPEIEQKLQANEMNKSVQLSLFETMKEAV